MPGSAFLNVAEIMARLRQGEFDAMEEVGDRLATDARRRAPIRKVFKENKGYRRKFRALTATEKRIALARSEAYYRGRPGFGGAESRNYLEGRIKGRHGHHVAAQVPRRGSSNALSASNRLRTLGYERHGKFTAAQEGVARLGGRQTGKFDVGSGLGSKLTSRGRYEIESGRAVHREVMASGHTRVRAGGALKASIGSEGASETSSGVKVVVSAAIRYAKFVEFPTIHNAAQPFMRPALHAMRAELPRIVGSHVRKALRG